MTEISASMVLHSKAPLHDKPIATMSLVYPRFVHSEFMTHRVFSRNAMSSRAVPVAKMIEQVRNDPAMPIHWGANQPGMQANGEVNDEAKTDAQDLWRLAAGAAASVAESMSRDLGLHKQVANRILEPFQWMHTIVTSTEWDNFFSLRLHEAAEPNIRRLAQCMQEALEGSTPVVRALHTPYVSDADTQQMSAGLAGLVSAARCARVSYLNHDGTAPDTAKDVELANKLRDSRHASPFEHVARAADTGYTRSRNFLGWTQFREQLGL